MQIIFWLMFFVVVSATAREKYLLSCSEQMLEESRRVLFEELGTREATNRNDGEKINGYLSSVGLTSGSSYCVAGQYYCFELARKRLGLPSRCNPLPRTGLSFELFRFAKRFGKKIVLDFNRDDLVVWIKNKSIHGHTERIVRVRRKGWVETVGFNTRRYDQQKKKWVEGVFLWRRNLLHPFGRMNLLGVVGFIAKNNGC